MNRTYPIRVMVVDDHQVVREGMISMLQAPPGISIVGQAATAPEAIRKAQDLRPDVVLLDIRLPDSSGWEVCRTLTSLLPETQVIMLTSFPDEDYLFKALQAGARGYLVKTASHKQILRAITSVVEGNLLLSAPLVDKLANRYAQLAREMERLESGFDQEEIDILKLLSKGATHQEIARRTHRSEISVSRRLEAIFDKLGVEDSTDASAEAMRRGLV